VDNRYLAAGGIGALVVAVVVAAFFFLTPQAAQTSAGGTGTGALALTESDIGMGDPKAPITMIEYASAGCGACAAFHIQVMGEIKTNWVDKGLVYYVLRDFPLDNVAAGASVIARCMPREKFYPFMDILFRNQPAWHGPGVADPKEALIELSRRAGLSREQVESCLKDQTTLGRIQASRDTAEKELKVNSTPTMFVNGEKIQGAAAYSEFEKKFQALLPADKK
jgi:protein-disulfide isomerase